MALQWQCVTICEHTYRGYCHDSLRSLEKLSGGGGYDLVRPALGALEALGAALEDHLPLLLPALVRLIHPGTLFRLKYRSIR